MSKKLIFTLFTLLSFASFAQTDSTAVDTAYLNKLAKQKIDTVYAKLMRGEDFAKLANAYSEDPGSNKTGGAYEGFFARGVLVPEFEKIIFELKVGETSKPFKTKYGWHVAQLIEVHGTEVKFRHILIMTPQ